MKGQQFCLTAVKYCIKVHSCATPEGLGLWVDKEPRTPWELNFDAGKIMNFKVIKTNEQYETTLARVSELIDLSIANTITNDQLEELDLLGLLVEKYEDVES